MLTVAEVESEENANPKKAGKGKVLQEVPKICVMGDDLRNSHQNVHSGIGTDILKKRLCQQVKRELTKIAMVINNLTKVGEKYRLSRTASQHIKK